MSSPAEVRDLLTARARARELLGRLLDEEQRDCWRCWGSFSVFEGGLSYRFSVGGVDVLYPGGIREHWCSQLADCEAPVEDNVIAQWLLFRRSPEALRRVSNVTVRRLGRRFVKWERALDG